MALLSIQTLLNPVTGPQIRTSWVQTLVTLGIPANQWVPGGVASTMLTIVSNQFASFQNLMVQAIGSGFLTTASGAWLQLLAFYVYGVTVPPATFASGALTLTNSGGGIYSFVPFTASFLNPTTGQVYQNVTAISLSGPSTQSITIQCTQSGSVGNAAPNAINTLVTTMLGVTCTNPASLIGLDQLADAAIRQLCINKLGVLSVRGPATAYQYAVQTATGVVSGLPVDINRSTVSASSSTGVVTIYVASPSGPATTDDVNGVIANIALIAQPDAVTVNVIDATAVADTDAPVVWVHTNGVPVATILAAINTALDNFYSIYPIGGLTTDAGTGLFSTGKDGVIGQAVQDAGGTIISVEGTNFLALTAGQVAVNELAVSVRAA
jgi:hypothetical protein